MSGHFRGSFSVDQGSFADRGSVTGLDTIGSSLSGSLKRRGTRAGQPSGGNDRGELSLHAFVRPKRGSDGGPRHDELVLLHYHPADDLHVWLQDVTSLLRQPLRGTNTFPLRACLNPTGFAVALYAVMQATYPATLVKMRSLEDVLEHCARLGPTASFFLHTVEQHSTGLQEAASAELRTAMSAARAKKAHIDAIFKPGYDELPPEDDPAEEEKVPHAAEAAAASSDPSGKLPALGARGNRAAGGSMAGGSNNKRNSKRASSRASGVNGSRDGSRNGSRRGSRNSSRNGSRRGSAAGSHEGEEEDDNEEEEGSGSAATNQPADFAMVLRHNLHKCAVGIEACCRKEAPPMLLAKWLLGCLPRTKEGKSTDGSGVVDNGNDDDEDGTEKEGTTPPVLTPALWKCFVVLCRDRVLADPRGALGPVSALLGAVGSMVQASTPVTVVKDVPSSKPQAIGAGDSLSTKAAPRRADPRGLVVHFMEQATLTTIDESDDTTFHGAPQGHNSLSSNGSGAKDDDASSLGSTDSSGSKSRVSSISSLGAGGSFVKDRSAKNAQNASSSQEEDGSSNSPRVRYTPFNDRSEDPIVPFYCHCLACEPDPDLDIEPTYEQNDRVYGLGAVRYWWQADYHPSLGAGDVYLVGNQTTERGLVRRVALGEPIAKVLAPTPGSLRRAAAATEARRARWRRKKGLAPRLDTSSSSSSPSSPLKPNEAGDAAASDVNNNEDGSTPLEDPAAQLERLIFELKVCGDPACAVRAAELEAEGWTDGSEVHSHGGGGGAPGGPVRAKKGDTAKSKGLGSGDGKAEGFGGSFDRGFAVEDEWVNGGAWAAKRTDNPVLAMLEGFGVHLEFEGEEFDGLQKVFLPPHDTPGVRTSLLDTFVANGVVARVWLAHGLGLEILDEKLGGRGGGGSGSSGGGGRESNTPSAATTSPGKGAGAGGNAPRSRRNSTNSAAGSQSSSSSRRGSKTPSANGAAAAAAADGSLPPIGSASPVSNADDGAPAADGGEDEEELFEIEEPKQHMVSWESLTQARVRSPWHGPFTSDGAARRHVAQFSDFSHVLFELCLRQPFAQELQTRREENHRSATFSSASVDANDHRDEMAGEVRWRGTRSDDKDDDSLTSGSHDHYRSRKHSARNVNKTNDDDVPLALVQRLALRDAALRRQDPVLFARNPDWDRARIPASAGALACAAVLGRNTTRQGKAQQQPPSGAHSRQGTISHDQHDPNHHLPPIGGTLHGIALDGVSLDGSLLDGGSASKDSRSHGLLWPGGLSDEGSSVYTAFEWPATYHGAPVMQQQSSLFSLSQPSAAAAAAADNARGSGSAAALGSAAPGGLMQSSSIDNVGSGIGGPSLEGEVKVHPRRFLRGKAKYGDGYVAPHVVRRLVTHLRRQGLQKQSGSLSEQRAKAKRRRSNSSLQRAQQGMASLDIRGGVEMVAEGEEGEEDDDDDDDEEIIEGASQHRRGSALGGGIEDSADMVNLSDDSEAEDDEKVGGKEGGEDPMREHGEEVDALDILADFSIELLRANAVRNDQVLSLLESLVGHAAAFPENTGDGAALGEGHLGAPPTVALPRTTASKASYCRMGAPGAVAAASDGSSVGGDDDSSHLEAGGAGGEEEDDDGEEIEEPGHCDPEAVLVACRLLLAGLGPWLESAASQVDAQAAKKTMTDDDWFEKELAQAANTSKAAASARSAGWPTSLNSGMPAGLPYGAYTSAGVRNPLTRTSAAAATTFPAASLFEADVEPRHSAPLTRLLRRIAFAPAVAPPDASLPPTGSFDRDDQQQQQQPPLAAGGAGTGAKGGAEEVEPASESVFGASPGSPTRSLPPHPVNAPAGGYPGGPGWEADLRWAADDLHQDHHEEEGEGSAVPVAGQQTGTNDSNNGASAATATDPMLLGILERGYSAAESDDSLLQADDKIGDDPNFTAGDFRPSIDAPQSESAATAPNKPSSHLGAAHYLASASRFLATSRLYRWDPKVARSVDAVEVKAQRAAAERRAQETLEAGLEAIREGARRSFDQGGIGGVGGSVSSVPGGGAPPDGHLAPHLHSYATGPFRAPPLHTLRSHRDRKLADKKARAKRRAERRCNAGHTTPAVWSDGILPLNEGTRMESYNEGSPDEESPDEGEDEEDGKEGGDDEEEAHEAGLPAAALEEAWARVTAAEAAWTQEAQAEREALRAAERAVEKWFDWDKDRPSFDVGATVAGDDLNNDNNNDVNSEVVDVGTSAMAGDGAGLAGVVNFKGNGTNDSQGNTIGGGNINAAEHSKEGGQEEHGADYNGANAHENHDAWTCPLTGAFLWRSERAAYLGQPVGPHQTAGASAYREAWLTELAALKAALKQAHARRKGLLLHGQAHVPFLDALCALVDCGGDEGKALKRFSGRAGHALMPAKRNSNTAGKKKHSEYLDVQQTNSQARAATAADASAAATVEEDEEAAWIAAWGEAYPRRDGELYKEEMALGSRVIGQELTAWMNEKRVRKNWAEILARNHAHKLPDGLVEHNAQQQEKRQQVASKEALQEQNQDGGAKNDHVGPAEATAIELVNWW